MRDLKHKFAILLGKHWPFLLIVGVVFLFFWKVFIRGLVPLPADLVVGAYYPWLDYKWGFEVGVPVKNPITSDVVSVIYPLRTLVVDLIKKGEIPLWNPHMFTGYPLLANFQVGVLSPTILLYFILPKTWGWTTQVIVQPILASIFSYLFLRHLKISKFASLIGGLIYAFSGFSIIWLEWNAHSLVAAWIPLVLLLVDKFIQKEHIVAGITLSVVIALQIFSGYPQLVMYTFLSLGILVIFRSASITKIFLLSIFVLLGVLLSSVQIIPALELLLDSQRLSERLVNDLVYLPWQNLITFFAPDYFGNHATGNFWGMGNYTNNAGYTGVVAFVLATIGIFAYPKRKEIKFLFVIFLVSLLITIQSPISEAIYSLGFFGSSAASSTRVLVLVNLAIAFLAAFGLEKILNYKKKQSVWLVYFPFIVLVIVLLYSLRVNQVVGVRNLILPIILVVASWLLLFTRQIVRSKFARLFIAITFGVIAVAELFRFGWKYTPFSEERLVFPETPVISYLVAQGVPNRVYFHDVIPMNMWVPYGLESVGGYDAVYPERMSKFIAVANSGWVDATKMGRHGTVSNYNSSLFDLVNMKYFLFLKKNVDNLDLNEERFRQIFDDRNVVVYENMNALSRAFIVYDWEIEKDGREVLLRLLDKGYPIDRKIIFVDSPPSIKPLGESGNYKVNYRKYDGQESVFDVTTDKDGFLFISDLYYPGWNAMVDGESTKIYRANYAFRAVPIKKGNHIVEFIYNPKSFKIGKWISFITAVSLATLYLYEKGAKKRKSVTRKRSS